MVNDVQVVANGMAKVDKEQQQAVVETAIGAGFVALDHEKIRSW
jgi:hypothetical protein